jgi:DNA-binding NtrC family response regulator
MEKTGQRDYAIYFVDLKMPGGMDGIETMMQIIIITAYVTVDTAITAMKEGAQERACTTFWRCATKLPACAAPC